MKKSFLLILCLLLTIVLVACNGDNNNTEIEDTTAADKVTTAEVTTAGGEETSEKGSEDVSEDASSEVTTTEETTEEVTTECVHELSDEIVGIATGHYHLTDCEHDLVLDLTAHTGTEDGICDECEYSFADLIDEITAPEAADKVNGGTVIYNGQYEKREASFQLGSNFFFMDENIEYSYEEGVIYNSKHSVHLLDNGNVFYVKDSDGMLERVVWDVTASNVKGYMFSSDMFDYLALDYIPCGAEDLLYAFYTYAKTNLANNLTTTWGATNNITFKTGDDYSAKVYSIDFTISENGVISALTFSYVKYYGPDLDELGEPIAETVKYTIDDNGVVTIVDGAVVDATISIEIAQTEGERTVTSTYNLDEILVDSIELTYNGAPVADTLNLEVGAKVEIAISNIAPSTANLDLDNITVTVVDETGNEAYDVLAFAMGDVISISVSGAGNFVVTITTVETTKSFAIVAAKPATTEISAAEDDGWGNKTAITSKDLYTGATFEFVAVAQNSYADATFTAVITEGPDGATLTELETADGYAFTATTAGTYVITLTSKANADVTNTLTVNVTDAPSVGNNFKGTWENTTYGIKVEINPTDATSGSYVVYMNNQNYQFTYELVGTTIDAFQVSGDTFNWALQYNAALELEIVSPYGMAFGLTQTSTGDEPEQGGDVEGFNGTYSGIVNVMGGDMGAVIEVTSHESFDFTIDGSTVTYYFSIDAATGYFTTICMGQPMAEFTFRYISDMDMVDIEMMHPMTGMNSWIGSLAKGEPSNPGTDAGDGVVIDGVFHGECPDYYGTVFTITFEGNTMHILDESMGGEVTFTYTVNEYGELTLDYVSGEEMVVMDLQFVYYADTEILVVNRLNYMTGSYVWVGQLEKEASSASSAIEGVFHGECPDYYGTVFTITFEGDTMHILDESMGGEATFTYTVNEYGELILTYVSGEEMVVMDLQFVYYADTEILVVNRLNYMTGTYVWVGELEKTSGEGGESGSTLPNIEGYWSSVDGRYFICFYPADGDGTLDFSDENGEWLKTRGFYYTLSEDGIITFTSIKGNLSGFMDWSTNSYAVVSGDFITLVLDTGDTVMLTPVSW